MRAHRIDLLDEGLCPSYLADPGGFAGQLRALEPGSTVVVDGIEILPVAAFLGELERGTLLP